MLQYNAEFSAQQKKEMSQRNYFPRKQRRFVKSKQKYLSLEPQRDSHAPVQANTDSCSALCSILLLISTTADYLKKKKKKGPNVSISQL